MRLLIRFALLLVLGLFVAPTASAQGIFQAGHTHDILQVRFSPDGTKVASYSWGDGWLCYWDVASGQLLWKSKTGFIQKADEGANIEAFGWSVDSGLLYTRSENSTYQTWEAKTGKLLSVSESNPDVKAFARTKVSVRKDYQNFYVPDSRTGNEAIIKNFSGTGSVYDLSDDGKLFAEGGSWGNAVIRITEVANPQSFRELKGGKIPPYTPTELETRLEVARMQRKRELSARRYERDKRAAIETEQLKSQVRITFDHYGDMTNPGELRMMESSEPKLSKVVKSGDEATAVWLRLHNDSPLPIQIPTQSMYLPNPKCFHSFPGGEKILGLCDGREIAIWFGLEDAKGKALRYGFDFGSAATLLPHTSALFAVPRELLRDGKAIRFQFTFQNAAGEPGSAIPSFERFNYGTPKLIKFRESDLPKTN